MPDLLGVKTSSSPFQQGDAFPRDVLGQGPCEAQCIQALSGQMGPKERCLLHVRLMMLLCGCDGAGIIGERDGVSSGSLLHFLCDPGEVAGRLGSLVEKHLSSLDSNHLTLHPHCRPFVFLQELQEMSG